MKINIKVFYKLVVPFLLVIAMHAQNSKFVISLQYIKKKGGITLQYIKKKGRDKVDFFACR